ncbi:MAG: hypothetical protein QM725_11965 [Lacibacter sp.]
MILEIWIHGDLFDAYNFLLELKHLPPVVHYWEPDDPNRENFGFNFQFYNAEAVDVIPFSFGRFLVANKELLCAKQWFLPGTKKEIYICYEKEELVKKAGEKNSFMFVFKPGLMQLLAETGFVFYISREWTPT